MDLRLDACLLCELFGFDCVVVSCICCVVWVVVCFRVYGCLGCLGDLQLLWLLHGRDVFCSDFRWLWF